MQKAGLFRTRRCTQQQAAAGQEHRKHPAEHKSASPGTAGPTPLDDIANVLLRYPRLIARGVEIFL